MIHNIGEEVLERVQEVEAGAMGTKMWSRGEIIWAANTGLIVIATLVGVAFLVNFDWILVPLLTSYFFTFLSAPIMDLLEHRPLECGCVMPAATNTPRRSIR